MDKILDNGKPQKTEEFYDFGEFRLNAGERRLWRGEELVALTPKEFEVLFFLLTRAGRVVEKGELLDAIWAETYVEETTLARNVSWLRKKLGEGVNGEIFIETVPKRGYRFIAEVVSGANRDALAAAEKTAIIVEEQTVRHLLIEETLTLAPENDLEKSLPVSPDTFRRNPKSAIRNPQWLWLAFGVLAAALTGLLAYQFFYRQPEQKIIRVSKVAPFSGSPGRENQPAFSPDGKLLAFTWNGGEQGDNADVYVKMIGAGEAVRLTDNRADDVSPTFAPDGKNIAFIRVLPTRSEVFLVPALGGAERKICDLSRNSSTVSFAPGGRFLAVYDADESGQPGIFTVNIENGEKKRLTAPPELAIDDQPAFAPDGNSLAFIRSQQNAREIFIVPATGGEARQLTFDKEWLGGIAWSADGKDIFFSSRRKYNGRANLWQIEAAGGEQPEVIATGSERLGTLAVSPDNRTIAFVEESYDTNIWRVEPGKLPGREAFHKFAPSSRNDDSPNVSPDGKQVVFASTRAGNYSIWIADAGGANARQLIDLPNASAGSPRFSPDGKWVAFDAQIEGNGDIFVVPANGGAARRLTDSAAFDYMPSWSADGGSIYFASNRGGAAQIYQIPVNGGEIKQITSGGGNESYASLDGKYLYYRQSESKSGLWRVPAEGGEEQAVPQLTEAGYWRYWTLTSGGVYFVQRSENPPYKIMFYDFSSNELKEITATDVAPISVYPGIGVSADGTLILYAQNDQNASAIMLAELGN